MNDHRCPRIVIRLDAEQRFERRDRTLHVVVAGLQASFAEQRVRRLRIDRQRTIEILFGKRDGLLRNVRPRFENDRRRILGIELGGDFELRARVVELLFLSEHQAVVLEDALVARIERRRAFRDALCIGGTIRLKVERRERQEYLSVGRFLRRGLLEIVGCVFYPAERLVRDPVEEIHLGRLHAERD